MIKYKEGILDMLKKGGYSTYRIRKDKLIGERALQNFREESVITALDAASRVCQMLGCQPGDLLEYVPDQEQDQEEAGKA